MVFILTLFAKAIGFTVIALLNTFKVLDIDGKIAYNIYIFSNTCIFDMEYIYDI